MHTSEEYCPGLACFELLGRKWTPQIVWALLDNPAACDFYWRRGGRPVANAFTRIGGERLEKVAFAWR